MLTIDYRVKIVNLVLFTFKRLIKYPFVYQNWLVAYAILTRLGVGEKVLKLRNGIKFQVRTNVTDLAGIDEQIIANIYKHPAIDKLSKNDVVIDIGSSIGDFSILLAIKSPEINIHCFEIDKESLVQARKNIKLNNIKNIRLHNYGIRGNSIPEEKNILFKSLNEILSINSFSQPKLIKLDCEGFEYDIIFNTDRSLLKNAENIIMEWHNVKTKNKKYQKTVLKKYLENLGFKVYEKKTPVFKGTGLFYCVNKRFIKTSILWLYPHLTLWQGGTRFIADLSSYINAKYNISLITSMANIQLTRYFQNKGVVVVNQNLPSTNKMLFWLFSPLWILIGFIKTLQIKGDVYLATLFPSTIIAALCSLINKRPFIHFCYEPVPWLHNYEYISLHGRTKKLFLTTISLLYKRMDYWSARKAKVTLTLDKYKSELIYKTYHIKPKIVLVGIDPDHFKPIAEKKNLFNKLYKNKKILLHSTDYTPIKRTTNVLEVFSKVVKKINNSILLITSTRPNTAEERELIKKSYSLNISRSTKFLGTVDYSKLPQLYNIAKCYLSLSTMPMTATNLPVKEALMCGTFAVRTKTGTDDVINNKTGYIVDPNNQTDLVRKISLLLNRPDRSIKEKIKIRNTIINKYRWINVAQRFERHIKPYL